MATICAGDQHGGMPSLEAMKGAALTGSLPDFDLDFEEKAMKITEDDMNYKTKQKFTGWTLLWAAWQSTGVIYGDIGTSPLYVYSSTFTSHPSWDDLVGALSIIIWSLILIVTLKYCFIVLAADDDGQGGTFALYSLLLRFTNIGQREPATSDSNRLERHKTTELRAGGRSLREFLEKSRISQAILQALGVLGVSMVLADGVLTPAQSVLGAIQGIRVANPDLGTSEIVGTSCAILIVLFLIQPLGTSKIGTGFAPVVVIWLLFNFCSGVYNLALHDYTVLKAFSPHYAFLYLIRNGYDGWQSLGGLLLAFTGVEALFADLGAFGKRGIQLSWICFAFPCLLFAYIGQAAYIAVDHTEEAYTNPFFNTVPPGSFYFSLVMAVLAAIVASQALITSSFQLLSQVMRMSYFPHIKKIHTSQKFHEQVYIPMANWLLMIGTVIVTAVYNNTTSLGNAYGMCVIIVTLITTCLLALVGIIIWRIPSIIVIFIFLFFFAMEGAFMSATMRKVPHGAWFTLLLAFVLSSIFILWRWGKRQQWTAEAEDNVTSSHLLEASSASSPNEKVEGRVQMRFASDTLGGAAISTIPGLGIFFDKTGGLGDYIPKVFSQFILKFRSRPEVTVFFHMRPLPVPSIPVEERFVITRASPHVPSSYRITLRHGYMDNVLTADLGLTIIAQLENFIGSGSQQRDQETRIRGELEALRRAQASNTVYILGKQVMRVRRGEGNMIKRFFRAMTLELFLWIRENSRTKLADLDMDYNNLVEVGFVKEI